MEHLDLLALVAEECAHYDDCTLDGTPISLAGDPRLLRRLVRNLLENAARHGKPPVRVELRRGGADAVLRVINSGCGIPEAERERIFLPFFQLAGDRKGTGLGLSLVRQIARLHGGEAAATSQPDVPSCFLIKIPIRSPKRTMRMASAMDVITPVHSITTSAPRPSVSSKTLPPLRARFDRPRPRPAASRDRS